VRDVNLTIESVAFGGKGIGRANGKAIFVPFTIDGETVSARIVREKKQFAEAEIADLGKRSPHRVEPKCPYFGRCGGCAYQHIDYEHQLAIKAQQVREVLQRIGKLTDVSVRPVVPSPFEYGYRNRITVHARDGAVGYFRRDSNELIDVERCPIAADEVNAALADLRESNPRDGHYTLRVRSGPRIFSQTNDAVAAAMLNYMSELVPAGELLIDAFCGAGFFAKALRDKFQRIIGIDWDRFAIVEATKNATEMETYIAGDIEKVLRDFRKDSNQQVVMIVDPPSTGLCANIRQSIVDFAPATFIYVSCNPATLARDLLDLRRKFKIVSVTPFDMFPQTAEIEVVAQLSVEP
jgi:tRNA/tmRNA/rRNA uracil-C5-methylase (TrmA/RlmC/RlmD family)